MDESLIGVVLEHRYRVTSLLARGGMSTVYRGVDTRLDRPVAIKVLHPSYAADRSFAERFEHEARAAAKLHHPNVVAVHDQGVDRVGDTVQAFLVMELVEGGTLRDLIDQRGKLDPALALSVMEPLLEALTVAHRAGLVHRDVKPENVLIGHGVGPRSGEGAQVKVADFGLVRAIAGASVTSSSVILGTVAYLSPEQVTTGEATPRSDVYSSGLLLYEMLTGKPAFTGDTALSVAYRHVNDDVPRPSESTPAVPPRLDALVRRATSRDPEARPADAAELLTEVRAARTDLGLARMPIPVQPAPDMSDESGHDRTLPTRRDDHAGPQGTRAFNRAALPFGGVAEEEPHPADEAPARPRRRLALLALLTLLLAALAGGTVWWLTAGQEVLVPKVAGMTKDRALKALQQAELEAKVVEQRHNDVEAGLAIGTEPAAGSEARKGDTATLLISLGKPKVPDIETGTAPAAAHAAILKEQLKPKHDAGADQYDASVPKGTILTVSPEPGTAVKIGSTVSYGLSKGPPPTPVPDVTGMSEEDAFRTLREKGFEPYKAGEDFDENVAKGHVVRTDPQKGATPEGQRPRVGVYLSNAVEVPSVLGRSVTEAEDILREAGLRAELVEGGNGYFSLVFDQDRQPGTKVKPDTVVRLKAFP